MTMKTNEKIDKIIAFLDEIYPSVGCELNYSKPHELVIAVLLSAQSTDKSVNLVTKDFFVKYPTLEALNSLSVEEIEEAIHSIGLYKNKAKHIKELVGILLTKYHGEVPTDKNELMTLPGIGNKSAGVIRAEIFRIPELPVDTHVARISARLGLAKKSDEPIVIEKKLTALFPKERWILTHHQFIHFGRYYCTSRNPRCDTCKLRDFCKK